MDVDGRVLVEFGGEVRLRRLPSGQWWRLVTAGFLHGGLIHIFMNSWVLFSVGAQVEETYGTARYLVLYFVSTVVGFLASTYFSPQPERRSVSAGALRTHRRDDRGGYAISTRQWASAIKGAVHPVGDLYGC